jgi:hypothetical protein
MNFDDFSTFRRKKCAKSASRFLPCPAMSGPVISSALGSELKLDERKVSRFGGVPKGDEDLHAVGYSKLASAANSPADA